MRKTVIALILVLPILFVLVVFAAGNTVSISVPVSVNGIHILVDGDKLKDDDVFEVDHTSTDRHTITAEVEPANASDKGYTLKSDNPDVLEIAEDGTVKTYGQGTANVVATSNDKGFTAKIPVVVNAQLVYGVNFFLFKPNGEAASLLYDVSTKTYNLANNSYLTAGKYTYKLNFTGGDSREYELTSDNTNAIVNSSEQSILLPFGGSDIRLNLSVPNAFDGTNQTRLDYDINLRVQSPQSVTGIVVNGNADGATLTLAAGTTKTILYVESEYEPILTGNGIDSVCITHGNAKSADSDKRHVLQVNFTDNFQDGDEIVSTLTANGKSVSVKFGFAEFDFDIRSDNIQMEAGEAKAVVLKNTATMFYAVSAAEASDITYEWSGQGVELNTSENTQSCTLKAYQEGAFAFTVTAKRDGKQIGVVKTVNVEAVVKVNSVTVTNNPKLDLAERYTMGGLRYGSSGVTEDASYRLNLIVSKQGQGPVRNDVADIEFLSSDESVATVQVADGNVYVLPKGTGAVTVTAEWRYVDMFGGQTSSIKLYVVKDAVEVDNYPDLVKATDDGKKIVLTKSIMLGTDKDYDSSIAMPTDASFPNYQVDLQAYLNNLKHVLNLSERQSIAENHKYRSTYNREFYSAQNGYNADEAYVKYALEFKADVFGNGFEINAEYITNAQDASGTPMIFRGPLSFVEYEAVASVAGQDNIAFLIRTDGVKLYGVNLLGCSDSSLYETDKDGNYGYQLNNLNNIGTTLEINADCEIVNCRIRNGRNTVRVYGGNKEGNNYFVDAVPSADVSDEDRIVVTIDGCIITQGREFLVKLGSNKALRANGIAGKDPKLSDESNVAYSEIIQNFNGKNYGSNNYAIADTSNGSFFYKHYVMTDLTLRNSVLETVGLFCVGVESNFAGAMLYGGAESEMTGDVANYAKLTASWRKSGGTSFPCILRLEGDVRTYGWQDVNKMDSSTLIEPVGDGDLSDMMKFNISAMLQAVNGYAQYGNLLYQADESYVHGGIAFYGGGRNYSQIVLDNLNDELKIFRQFSINIAQFENAKDNATVSRQAQLLPYAAGTHSFNFWMYTADGANNYEWQQRKSYDGVVKVPLSGD